MKNSGQKGVSHLLYSSRLLTKKLFLSSFKNQNDRMILKLINTVMSFLLLDVGLFFSAFVLFCFLSFSKIQQLIIIS